MADDSGYTCNTCPLASARNLHNIGDATKNANLAKGSAGLGPSTSR